MKKTIYILSAILYTFLLIISSNAHGGIVRAIQTGNWESTTTWLHGIRPTNGDSIIIPAGKSIKVTSIADYSTGAVMQLNIFGELTFQTGKKLILPGGSFITIQIAAMITPGGGGGNSNTITVGSTLVWNTAMGTLLGYLVLPSSPLPVELIAFKVQTQSDETALISWETATEVNNDYFDVEKSAEGFRFEPIGRVAGHGTSSVGFKYAFIDKLPRQGANYYRLKQVDFNGKIAYSSTFLHHHNSNKKDIVQLYPNPSNGEFFISLPLDSDDKIAEVTVADAKANVLLKTKFNTIPGSNGIHFTDSDTDLKPGIYFVTVTINEEPHRMQLVVY